MLISRLVQYMDGGINSRMHGQMGEWGHESLNQQAGIYMNKHIKIGSTGG